MIFNLFFYFLPLGVAQNFTLFFYEMLSPCSNVWLNCAGNAVNVYVQLNQLRQVKIDVVLRKGEEPIACISLNGIVEYW